MRYRRSTAEYCLSLEEFKRLDIKRSPGLRRFRDNTLRNMRGRGTVLPRIAAIVPGTNRRV